MPITDEQIEAAQLTQHNAAHDTSPRVRLVAGPGTGKSEAIGERIAWLLGNQVDPTSIRVVSFTRASSRDLRLRIRKYCNDRGLIQVAGVRVTTLHSLALSALRASGALERFPSNPMIMQDWETETIFDREFSRFAEKPPKRAEAIRKVHEAFWSTESWNPPNYQVPDPPISVDERSQFEGFHQPRTQLYCSVLPGEMVRLCVERMKAGLIDVDELLNVAHLIVDEYQDLNPMDLEFVATIVRAGVVLFAAGDDDQSVYSFRYSDPRGIQRFISDFPEASSHELSACFRCTPEVLRAANRLITQQQTPNRIPKHTYSLFSAADPVVQGTTYRWRFQNHTSEARIIAASSKALIDAGVEPSRILILLSSKRTLASTVEQELASEGLNFDSILKHSALDFDQVRFALALLRIARNRDDYLAYRVLLGALPGVGLVTCCEISDVCIASNLNYQEMFWLPLPDLELSKRARSALLAARGCVEKVQDWTADDLGIDRAPEVIEAVREKFGDEKAERLAEAVQTFPEVASVADMADLFGADDPASISGIVRAIYQRLDLPVPEEYEERNAIRILTMHGAKGLDADIVFIPGLEENVLPNGHQRPYPGLVLEAARLLYVSITRARAACFISFARARTINGVFGPQGESRFCGQLDGPFEARNNSLDADDAARLVSEIAKMRRPDPD